jgi:polyhydroxyalkanoate synthesis repressor PhaR
MCCGATLFLTFTSSGGDRMQKPSSKDSKTSQRVIKKYPNRRLYDTDTSTYITLAEIKRLVMDNEAFAVVDAKSGEDITRSILLQIILEEEANGSPMFTTPVLANIIRFYGHTMQGMMGGYLEKNMQALMDMQVPIVPGVAGANMFQQMQEQMQKQTEQFLGTFGLKR